MLERNFSSVYFLQHTGTYAMLAAVFGVTLDAGGKRCAPGLPKRPMAAWRRTRSAIRAKSRWRGR